MGSNGLANRERERETTRQTGRQTDMDVREKHLLVASRVCPDLGSNLQHFGVEDDAPAKPASQAQVEFFKAVDTGSKKTNKKAFYAGNK